MFGDFVLLVLFFYVFSILGWSVHDYNLHRMHKTVDEHVRPYLAEHADEFQEPPAAWNAYHREHDYNPYEFDDLWPDGVPHDESPATDADAPFSAPSSDLRPGSYAS